MSIVGSVTGLFIMVLRKIKILPRFAVYLLWMLPLIRLWIPFGVANQYSLLNFLSRFTTKTVVVWQDVSILPEFSMTNSVMAASSYFPIEYKTNLLDHIFSVTSLVWIVVAVAGIFTAVLLYFLTKPELNSAVLIKDNVYKSDKITAPAVYGIFHPQIIIPSAISEGDIGYILVHEKVHIKRKDNLFRVIAIITVCIHWFNPLAWIFLKCFLSDMEFACDAKVLKTFNKGESKEYARALLSCASGKAFFTSAFGGAKTKVRIENILSYKKLTLVSSLFFALLIAAITIVLITNAVR